MEIYRPLVRSRFLKIQLDNKLNSFLRYFWSAEFLGGVFLPQANPHQRWRRVGFVLLIVTSGFMAATAGPAAAVLMIPRRLEFPVGGSIFWLIGGDEDLWPTTLNASYYSQTDCSPEQSLRDKACPAFGFAALHGHYSRWWNFQDGDHEFHLGDGFLRKVMYIRPAARPHRDTWVYTTHGISAQMQDAMVSMHRSAIGYLNEHNQYEYPWPMHLVKAEIKAYELETKLPAVRVACLSQGKMDMDTDSYDRCTIWAGRQIQTLRNMRSWSIIRSLMSSSRSGTHCHRGASSRRIVQG